MAVLGAVAKGRPNPKAGSVVEVVAQAPLPLIPLCWPLLEAAVLLVRRLLHTAQAREEMTPLRVPVVVAPISAESGSNTPTGPEGVMGEATAEMEPREPRAMGVQRALEGSAFLSFWSAEVVVLEPAVRVDVGPVEVLATGVVLVAVSVAALGVVATRTSRK